MKKKILLACLLLGCALTFTGCSKDKNKTEAASTEDMAEQMEDGMFYVRAMGTNKIKPVYFGNATFDKGSTSIEGQTSHVMWFKEDFEDIPTLYSGDSLIMHTDQVFDEHFIFERFEDVGYSIGLCHLEETDSGRYAISTDPEKLETYPGGDTDVILDDYKNEKVIIDTIGGIPIRKVDEATTSASFVSKFGTILNLNKDQPYKVEIYEGTNKSEQVFTADVHILGSMGGINSVEYYFDENDGQYNIINIKIPQEYNSGYYLINGVGMFRYVNGSDSWGDSTNFNIPNPDDVTFSAQTVDDARAGATDGYYGHNTTPNSVADGIAESTPAQEVVQTKSQKFYISSPSIITISVDMDDTNKVVTDPERLPSGKVISPSEQIWTLDYNNETMSYGKKFVVEEAGNYFIEFNDLDGSNPVVSVSAKKLTDEQLEKIKQQSEENQTVDDEDVEEDEDLD